MLTCVSHTACADSTVTKQEEWIPFTFPAPLSVRSSGTMSHPKYVTVYSKKPVLCGKIASFYNLSLQKLEELEAYNARGPSVRNRSFFPSRDLGNYSTSFIQDNPRDLRNLGLSPIVFNAIGDGFSVAAVMVDNRPAAIAIKDRSFNTIAGGIDFTFASTSAYLLNKLVKSSNGIKNNTILDLSIDGLAKAQPLWAGRASTLEWPIYLLQYWPWMKHPSDIFAYVNQHANSSADIVDLSPSLNSGNVVIRFVGFENRIFEVMNPTFDLKLPIKTSDEQELTSAEKPIVVSEVTFKGVNDDCYIQLQPNAEQW